MKLLANKLRLFAETAGKQTRGKMSPDHVRSRDIQVFVARETRQHKEPDWWKQISRLPPA